MSNRADLELRLVNHLHIVDRVVAVLARRHGMSGDDADEFASWARLRLVERDYELIAKFRGESSFATYLAVVVSMLYREYRVAEWGRWRPSAAARRGGALAVRLETLTARDGLSLAQAGELLRTNGETLQSDRELATLAAGFPRRTPLRPVRPGLMGVDAPASASAEELVDREESERDRSRIRQALGVALEGLSDEDRVVVRLHFMEALTVAEIARGLALPQKRLYKRLERSLRRLRDVLELNGITREQAAALTREGE